MINGDTVHYINGERQIRVKDIVALQPEKNRVEKPNDPTRESRIELYRVRESAGLDIWTGHLEGDAA
tara:strand:+ start:463 stop:663 length:201 start_codon:yes stop_codon:yes gene_type:complete